jgi:curved DNA-binding protein CbpA
MVQMNMMASLCLFAVLVSFSTTHPAHSFLISQHGLITSKFPEEKSNIATRNRNIKKNGIIINNISIRLQSSYQREPQNEASGGSSNINSEDEGKELTLYEILRATPNDTRSEIKSQYIALARISHPDAQLSKEKGEGGIDEDAVVDFQQIAEAWRTLGNAASRRKYDRKLGALEWGEKAQRLTNERLDQAVPIALNFLRRTTAVGQAIATGFSSSSMSTSTSSPATENEDDTSNNNNVEINNDNDKDNTNTISNIDDDEVFEMDHEQVADEVVSNGSKQNKATETTLTDTFISALEAGKQAGRDVDTLEINENSFELHER